MDPQRHEDRLIFLDGNVCTFLNNYCEKIIGIIICYIIRSVNIFGIERTMYEPINLYLLKTEW